jgi:hypothetical protein
MISIWGLLFLFQLIHLSRSLYRVRRLREEAFPLSPAVENLVPGWVHTGPGGIALLQSATTDVPVTAGIFHPVIVLPSAMAPGLSEPELSAVLAHEYAHICRGDFFVHLLCEFLSLPVAWHPGIRYLMAKISQTRELACDEDAALRLGKRRLYARALLRLASLCVPGSPDTAAGLGIFDGDNLEDRIMNQSEKKLPLSRAGLIGLVLATGIAFGSSVALARAISLQAGAGFSNAPQAFAGTWHWMFNGRSFATMILVPQGSSFAGTATESKIAVDSNGDLSRADPSDDSAPLAIKKTTMQGDALRVTIADGFEFLVVLKDQTHAEIHPLGAPVSMKPIPAEKVH